MVTKAFHCNDMYAINLEPDPIVLDAGDIDSTVQFCKTTGYWAGKKRTISIDIFIIQCEQHDETL